MPVAIKFPAAFVVIIEFAANVVAARTCDASVDDETVETIPFDPVYAKPWDRDGKKRLLLKVEEAVENNPFWNPIVVEVEL